MRVVYACRARTQQTASFAAWLAGLRDRRAEVAIRVRIARIEAGNLGKLRDLGDGVSEAKIDYGPGYRLYFTRRGGDLLILLCGGDKGSQRRDIAEARRLAAQIP